MHSSLVVKKEPNNSYSIKTGLRQDILFRQAYNTVGVNYLEDRRCSEKKNTLLLWVSVTTGC